MYFAGVDIGSTMSKIVILGDDVVASIVGPTGAEHRRLANEVMKNVLEKANLSFEQIAYVIATGYGRVNVPFADKQVTEISCHAKGIGGLFPQAKTVIDIGGQDCKAIKLAGGNVVDFIMNDKCAAGTGRFLEVMAEALDIKLKDMGELSLRSNSKVNISNTCTIFAEQEVISNLADGIPVEDILAGIHYAVATRIHAMAQRIKIEREVAITGGGAKNVGLIKAIEDRLGYSSLVPQEPLLTGALGAAILGKEIVQKANNSGAPIQIKERRLEEVTFFDQHAS